MSSFNIQNSQRIENITIDDIVIIITTGEKRLHHAQIAARTWVRHMPSNNFFFYSDKVCSNLPNCRQVGGAEEGALIKTKVITAFNEMYQQFPNKKWLLRRYTDTTYPLQYRFSNCLM
jgi:hypothetical protein